MIYKKILFLTIILFIFFTIFKYSNRNLNKIANKKILGLQINGIGNGHITQAIVIYNVLIKYYKIPIVIIYNRENGYDNFFNKSKVIYQNMFSSEKSTNNFGVFDIIHGFRDAFKRKKTLYYEKVYNINLWFNFLIQDFFNFHSKQICIAYQYNLPSFFSFLCVQTIKKFTNSIIVSIHTKSPHSKYFLPPLINLKKNRSKKINKKLILAYSVSGQKFPTILANIANNNKSYNFKYFTKTKLDLILPNNVELFKPEREKFSKYFKICSGVLCTSGNELILECVYNNIPVATVSCSKKQFEQNINMEKYINLKYAVLMTENLDIKEFVNNDVSEVNKSLENLIKNRDNEIIKLCDIF